MNRYSNIIKQDAINLYRVGTPAAEIAISLSTSRSTVYKWFKEQNKVTCRTFYNFILRNKRDNTWYLKRQEELRIKIQEIYDENNQIFGAAKITAVLKEQGYQTSEKIVRKLMRDIGLISIRQDAKSIYDNSVMESFFSSLKREELYRTKYRSEKELRTAIDNYMLFYNEKRPHAQNGYKTPLRKETEYRERQK